MPRERQTGSPLLFDDEQIHEFIVNGYVVLNPEVPDDLHESILQKLQFVFEEEFNPGNNILPRVPEMYRILNSPEVQGALISVLGENVIEHPHRHCHYIGPGAEDGPPQRSLAENCHQDSYTPLARPRQHYPRYARIMYYPQDTPVELGPTHVIPGTHYNKAMTDEDRARPIPIAGKAGTVSITHFDVGHAAGINLLDQPRHMIKFVYVRAEEPVAPSWNCLESQWRRPKDLQAPYDLEVAWSHIWDWMCGKRDRYESLHSNGPIADDAELMPLIAELSADRDLHTRLRAMRVLAIKGERAAEAVPALINLLNTDHQAARVAAVYALGAIGSPSVEPLVSVLRESGRREDAHPVPRPWKDGVVAMDDAANGLAAVGASALPALIDLLSHNSEWVRVNAAFALGEMDSGAAEAVPDLARCLEDPSHCVVRTAADALGSIRKGTTASIPGLSRLLRPGRSGWTDAGREGWTADDQVRINAALAFARMGRDAAQAEDILIEALDDPCGQVASYAVDALQRIGSNAAVKAAMDYLHSRRWDETIVKGRRY